MVLAAPFELPYLEDIYDMETEELEQILNRINRDMQAGESQCVQLPSGIETFEKYERKAAKLKDSLELELEERQQVDNVLNFFTDSSKNFLDDDAFYKLDDASGTTASKDSQSLQSSTKPAAITHEKTQMIDTTQSKLDQKNLALLQQEQYSRDQNLMASQQFQNGAAFNQSMAPSQLQNEIDPNRLMDDQQSEYSTSQQSHAKLPQDDDAQSSMMSRKPMTKKELQAFMKAKLAKTKVTSSATTGSSASGPATKNFAQGNRRAEPTQRKDL